jgi:hypothetical protein
MHTKFRENVFGHSANIITSTFWEVVLFVPIMRGIFKYAVQMMSGVMIYIPSRSVDLGSTQPLTKLNSSNPPGDNGRSTRKAASSTCYKDSGIFFFTLSCVIAIGSSIRKILRIVPREF